MGIGTKATIEATYRDDHNNPILDLQFAILIDDLETIDSICFTHDGTNLVMATATGRIYEIRFEGLTWHVSSQLEHLRQYNVGL